MSIKEWAKDFKEYVNNLQLQNDDCKGVMEYIDDALEIMKEQEPLEPTRVIIEQVGPLYHRCYCKKCGHHVGNMVNNRVADVHEDYCSRCGQAVKWV